MANPLSHQRTYTQMHMAFVSGPILLPERARLAMSRRPRGRGIDIAVVCCVFASLAYEDPHVYIAHIHTGSVYTHTHTQNTQWWRCFALDVRGWPGTRCVCVCVRVRLVYRVECKAPFTSTHTHTHRQARTHTHTLSEEGFNWNESETCTTTVAALQRARCS